MRQGGKVKLAIISTNVYALPPRSYAGVEMLTYQLALGLAQRGHQVAVVAPEGSKFPQGVELLSTSLREPEEASWPRYRERLGEFEVIVDASWERWSMVTSAQRDSPLAIVNWFHSSPTIYRSPPPAQHPMWVGLSKAHAEEMSRAWGHVRVRHVYNGIDTDFYKASGKPRGQRLLALGRYTPEKGFMEAVQLAQRLRVPLDLYGDMEIIRDPNYPRQVMAQADGLLIRANPGVSREMAVDLFSTHKALLHLHQWLEPLGLVVLEAMACGCPPIASKRGGPMETIRHGETGFLVEDVAEAEAIIKEDRFKEISPEAMRRSIEERFSLKVFVDSWEQLLHEIAQGQRW